MKYKLFRKNFEVWKNEITLLPTITITINDMIYCKKSIAIRFDWLVFHCRLLWLEQEERKEKRRKRSFISGIEFAIDNGLDISEKDYEEYCRLMKRRIKNEKKSGNQ